MIGARSALPLLVNQLWDWAPGRTGICCVRLEARGHFLGYQPSSNSLPVRALPNVSIGLKNDLWKIVTLQGGYFFITRSRIHLGLAD